MFTVIISFKGVLNLVISGIPSIQKLMGLIKI